MAHYLDTSALMKLVVAEPETAAMRAWLAAVHRAPVTSDLTRTELLRATRRAALDRAVRVRAVLDGMSVLTMDTAVYETAARLDPALLRSLDALHLAAALELGDELEGLVTYDVRLAEAARANGVSAFGPE